MNKPVDTIAFWDKRIKDAEAIGKIGHSVFATDDWESIDKAHLDILDDHLGTQNSVLEAGCGYGRSVDLMAPFKRYVGVDQVPRFIEMARETYGPSDGLISFREGVLPGCLICYRDNEFDWVVGISLMVMVISNLGWGKWDAMRKELLRVSRIGVLCLEYTDPEVYYLIGSN